MRWEQFNDRKKQGPCRSKEREQLSSTSHQQVMCSRALGSRASARVAEAREDRRFRKESPPFSFPCPSSRCRARYRTVRNVPWVGPGQLPWPRPLPSTCPPPACWRWGLEAAPMLCPHGAKRRCCVSAVLPMGCRGERELRPRQSQDKRPGSWTRSL